MASTAEVANLLLESETTVALTGAGISKASGMPTFRGEDGLWDDEDSSQWAYRHFFDLDPAAWYEGFWQFYNMHRGLAPSAAHYALRDMVEASVIDTVVTQNVDSFDLMAGTPESKLLEVHGHDRSLSCVDWQEQRCRYTVATEEWLLANNQSILPLCPYDGDPLKPDIILLNDTFVPDHVAKAYQEAPKTIKAATTLVVVGTSLEILPWYEAACDFSADEDKSLVVINPDPTPADRLARLVIHSPAEEVLPEIRDLVVG